MDEKKIIVAGYVSLDITPSFPHAGGKGLRELIKPGKMVNVGAAAISPGGCVTNTGLALHKMGADVTLIGKVGSDPFGSLIINAYRALGNEPHFIISETESTSYTIVIAPPGCDRCFLADSGANHSFRSDDLDYEEVAKAQYFHFGYPSLMRSFYEKDGAETAKLFRKVKSLGLVTSLDIAAVDPEGEAAKTDWEKALSETLPYVDFFVPSIEELCYMLDREHYEALQRKAGDEDVCMTLSLSEDVEPLAKKALSLGCRAVLLKCGAAGMYLAAKDEETMQQISPQFAGAGWGGFSKFEDSFVPDRILSGTGAGDTSIAAFLYGLSHGFGPEDCLKLAAGTGASCITEYDSLSGLLPVGKLQEKIESGWKKQHFIKP